MRMTGFSELSAVCTLPEYTGRGYAQQLMAQLCRRQMAAGITPFLHVAKANQRALRLYAHLGFLHRRDISFWRVKKEYPLSE
jgi:predicted GNAT family acetyltransferase